MKSIFAIGMAALLMMLAACQSGIAPDRTGRGGPAQLVYAPVGTQIKLLNASNGKASESTITVAAPTGFRGAYSNASGGAGGFYPGC